MLTTPHTPFTNYSLILKLHNEEVQLLTPTKAHNARCKSEKLVLKLPLLPVSG